MSEIDAIRLLVSSGNGPRECERAVTHCLAKMEREAAQFDVSYNATFDTIDADLQSAIITVKGQNAHQFARKWIGTVQWVCPSPFRAHHKRSNWFIGVFALQANDSVLNIDEKDITYEAFRAGGPGGQHQNTTNSAVRATHKPTGISVISRDERSQHRNKQTAKERLQDRLLLLDMKGKSDARSNERLLHDQLERGNPVRTFKGVKFEEA